MAGLIYTVNFTDEATGSFTIQPYTTNGLKSPNSNDLHEKATGANTSLVLPGKKLLDYGELIAEDFLHILENFASYDEPKKAIPGQLWYDKNDNTLKYFDITKLKITNVNPQGINVKHHGTSGSVYQQLLNSSLLLRFEPGYHFKVYGKISATVTNYTEVGEYIISGNNSSISDTEIFLSLNTIAGILIAPGQIAEHMTIGTWITLGKHNPSKLADVLGDPTKLYKTFDCPTSDLDLGGYGFVNLGGTGTNSFLTQSLGDNRYINKSGDNMDSTSTLGVRNLNISGNLIFSAGNAVDFSNRVLGNIGSPVDPLSAVNRQYVDNLFSSSSSAINSPGNFLKKNNSGLPQSVTSGTLILEDQSGQSGQIGSSTLPISDTHASTVGYVKQYSTERLTTFINGIKYKYVHNSNTGLITFLADNPTSTSQYSVEIIDPAANNATASVSFNGTLLTINLGTNAVGAITTTFADIKNLISTDVTTNPVFSVYYRDGNNIVSPLTQQDFVWDQVTAPIIETVEYDTNTDTLYLVYNNDIIGNENVKFQNFKVGLGLDAIDSSSILQNPATTPHKDLLVGQYGQHLIDTDDKIRVSDYLDLIGYGIKIVNETNGRAVFNGNGGSSYDITLNNGFTYNPGHNELMVFVNGSKKIQNVRPVITYKIDYANNPGTTIRNITPFESTGLSLSGTYTISFSIDGSIENVTILGQYAQNFYDMLLQINGGQYSQTISFPQAMTKGRAYIEGGRLKFTTNSNTGSSTINIDIANSTLLQAITLDTNNITLESSVNAVGYDYGENGKFFLIDSGTQIDFNTNISNTDIVEVVRITKSFGTDQQGYI